MGADHESIAAVYRLRYVGLAAALATVTGDREAGREVVQEGFATALRQRWRFRGGSLEAWIWKISLRAALRAMQSDGRAIVIDALEPQVVDHERDPGLTAAIGSLAPRRRLIVFLHYFADLSYGEIAEALEVSEGTVAATLARAREALAAELTREEGAITGITDAELRERLAPHLVVPEELDWDDVLWRMSRQREDKIRELEGQPPQSRADDLGDGHAAFASAPYLQGIFELTLETAIDACEAHGGRVRPLAHERVHPFQRGSEAATTTAALEAAERVALGGEGRAPPARGRAAEARRSAAHALAVAIYAPHGGPEPLGLVAIARGSEFTSTERELFEHLAGQAAISLEKADLHKENAHLHEKIQRQAITDELTGLANLRQLHTALDREIERSRRVTSPLGLVMLDLDDFKNVNDVFGHQQGDQVLVQVGRVLRELSRDIDEPARYGGEEFAVVLPETDCAGAAIVAERMSETIEALRIPRRDGQGDIQITASFGVASFPDTAGDKSSLIAAADAALLRAKRGGKNGVEAPANWPPPLARPVSLWRRRARAVDPLVRGVLSVVRALRELLRRP